MIFTGFYLWWPRGRSIGEALWPRWRAGPRTIIRDLHSTVAVHFTAVFLFFLSNNPPAEPGALSLVPLEAASGSLRGPDR